MPFLKCDTITYIEVECMYGPLSEMLAGLWLDVTVTPSDFWE